MKKNQISNHFILIGSGPLNDIKCMCRLLKANQASSEYDHELINFVNPQDNPEQIPIIKLHLSKDFPRKTHHLGTTRVKVKKTWMSGQCRR